MNEEINSLKELLINKICALEKLTNEQFEALETARDLQAQEYARRLDLLNHEADRLRSMQATYLPREVYESQHDELADKVDNLQSFKDGLTTQLIEIKSIANSHEDMDKRISANHTMINILWFIVITILLGVIVSFITHIL